MEAKERPLIVKILVILNIFSVLFSFALLAAFSSSSSSFTLILVGPIVGLVGIYYIAISYGLWKGKSWAWSLTMFFSILSLLGLIVYPIRAIIDLINQYELGRWGGSGLSPSIGPIEILAASINVIFTVAIIYALTRPRVKAFFGKQKYSLVDWFLGRKK